MRFKIWFILFSNTYIRKINISWYQIDPKSSSLTVKKRRKKKLGIHSLGATKFAFPTNIFRLQCYRSPRRLKWTNQFSRLIYALRIDKKRNLVHWEMGATSLSETLQSNQKRHPAKEGWWCGQQCFVLKSKTCSPR
jgi:hypothetical protein